VDKITVGSGSRGPVTAGLQEKFFGLFDGSTPDQWGWLEPIDAGGDGQADRTLAV
jgi:branched-chain amino acid aminotransferase